MPYADFLYERLSLWFKRRGLTIHSTGARRSMALINHPPMNVEWLLPALG
jgi:hypothetical protein